MHRWLFISVGMVLLWLSLRKRNPAEIRAHDLEIMERVLIFKENIRYAADRANVSPELVAAVIHVNSQGNPNYQDYTPYGKIYGLFGISCEDARTLGYKDNCEFLLKPSVNTFYGAKIIRWNIDNQDGDIYKGIVWVYRAVTKGDVDSMEYYAKRTLYLTLIYEGKF